MKDFPTKQVLIHYLLDICTPAEQKVIELWLDKEPKNAQLLEKVAAELGNRDTLMGVEKDNLKKSLRAYTAMDGLPSQNQRRVYPIGLPSMDPRSGTPMKGTTRIEKQATMIETAKSSVFYWFKVAAVLFITFSVGMSIWYVRGQSTTETTESIVWKERIMSFGQKATFRFPDGSVIHLNSGSLLRYPDRFEDGVREVYLEGEAFFTIVRDEDRPFIVRSQNATTRVLGTSFNVRSYRGEDHVQIAVAEGKVAVTRSVQVPRITSDSESNTNTFIVEKDQWIQWNGESGPIEQGSGNIHEMIAWKDSILIFNNKSIEEIARLLERWYGVTVRIESEGIKRIVMHGEHKDSSLEEVLKSMSYATGIEFTITENLVIIK